ncbi:MAG TPA: DUF11 domain-containing protein [Bacteroidetes bacterium]|nr:DUF11 domain-containing protein [Bacteroidota bacterium]
MNKQFSQLFHAALQHFLYGAFVAFSISAYGQTPCTNLLANPGFETGLNGWSTTGDVSITTDANTGSQAAEICGPPGSVGQVALATPGKTYTASVWGKYTGSPDFFTSQLRFLNSSFVPLPGAPTGFGFNSNTGYVNQSYSATAPAGAAYVHLIVYKENNGCVLVDDFEICEAAPALPGLSIINIACPTGFPQPGQPLSFDISVQNNGTAASPPTDLYINRQKSCAQCPSFNQVGVFTIPSIPAGGGNTFSASVNLPNDLALPGTYCSPGGPTSVTCVSYFDYFVSFEQNQFPAPAGSFEFYCKKYTTDLELQIIPDGPTYGADGLVSFIFRAKNNGAADAYNVTVHSFDGIVLPNADPTGIVTSGASFNVTTTDLQWDIPLIPANSSTDILVTYDLLGTGQFSTLPNAYPLSAGIGSGHLQNDPDAANNSAAFNFTKEGQTGNGIDLELSLAQPNGSPAQWTNYEVTATLQNTGGQTATGVEVSFAKPAGVVYTGGNEFTASQGTFNPNGDEIWTVGSIPAGGSATMTVSYFLLANTAPDAYAQVSAANETDSDSTPGNGTPPSVNEDDEASTFGGGPMLPDLQVLNVLPITGTVMPGDNLTGQFSLFYAGPFATVNFKYATYLSDDPVLSPDDHFINNQLYQVTSFPSGTATPFQVNFTMPTGLPSGQIYFLAVVDPTDELAESDENNNTGFNSFILDNGGTTLPDLTISNLEIPAPTVEAGQILNYNFDLNNIGNAAANGNFNVKAWISTDNALSNDDIQDGIVPTGNFAAGFSVQAVPGASTIPGNLAAGTYYLILKADADEQVSESSEGNNIVSATFTVTNGTTPPGDCKADFASGNLICASENTPGELSVVHIENGNLFQTDVDADGLVLSNQALGPVPPDVLFYTNINNELVKKVGNNVVWTKPIPASVLNGYAFVSTAGEFNGGFVLFAYKNQIGGTVDSLFAIRTDANLNPMFAKYIAPGAEISSSGANSALQIDNNRMAVMVRTGSAPSIQVTMYVIDDLLEVKSESLIISSAFSGGATIKPSPCGGFELNSNYGLYFCIHGSCSVASVSRGDFVNDAFLVSNDFTASEVSTMGQGQRSKSWFTGNVSGISYTASLSQDLPIPANPVNNHITVIKLQGGTFFWQKDIYVPDASKVVAIEEIGGELVFIQSDNGTLSLLNATCLENVPPPGDGVDLELSMTASNSSPAIYSFVEVTLTVNNTGTDPATGIVVDFPRPAGTVYTGGNEWSATQGSFNPFGNEQWTVGNIPAGGSASITVSYFLLSGNALTAYAQVLSANETDSDSTPGNGTPPTPNEDDEAALTLNAFAAGGGVALQARELIGRPVQLVAVNPNPVYHGTISVVIDSREAGSYELECYDLFGRLAFLQKINLEDGRNEVPLDVSRLESGTYYLNMPGENCRGMPMRFAVARW